MADWQGRVIDDPVHPWCSDFQHGEGSDCAYRIAYDLIANRRWESGLSPVYDASDGHYAGDDSDDRVRCQTHLTRIHVETYIWDSFAQSRADQHERVDGMAEIVYRALHVDVLTRAAELRDELRAMIASDRIELDDEFDRALRRFVVNGYTVGDLRKAVGA